MNLPEFFAGLADFYKSSLPGKSSIQYMRRRLDSEGLSSGQVDRLFDFLTDKCQYHPIWETINAAVGELGFRAARKSPCVHWVTFEDEAGRQWAMKCPDPGNPPRYPEWGRNGNLVVDRPIEDIGADEQAEYDRRARAKSQAAGAGAVFESAGGIVLDLPYGAPSLPPGGPISSSGVSEAGASSAVVPWDDL